MWLKYLNRSSFIKGGYFVVIANVGKIVVLVLTFVAVFILGLVLVNKVKLGLLETTVAVVDFVVVVVDIVVNVVIVVNVIVVALFVVTDNIYIQLWSIKVNLKLLKARVEFLWSWVGWLGWGVQSYFRVQPNFCVEVVLGLGL